MRKLLNRLLRKLRHQGALPHEHGPRYYKELTLMSQEELEKKYRSNRAQSVKRDSKGRWISE